MLLGYYIDIAMEIPIEILRNHTQKVKKREKKHLKKHVTYFLSDSPKNHHFGSKNPSQLGPEALHGLGWPPESGQNFVP